MIRAVVVQGRVASGPRALPVHECLFLSRCILVASSLTPEISFPEPEETPEAV